jgi:hypothetical protein
LRREACALAGLCGLVLLSLSGCDGFGLPGRGDDFDVPPERLVAMTAVFEETLEGGRPVHRLVVADVQNPSNYRVLSAAGRDVGRSCFGPEKRRLLFEDNSESNVGSRAPIKLLDLETREVRDLGATGTLKGCVWRADGSGFYYAAAGGAGLRIAAFYDLETGEARPFAQTETQIGAMRGSIPYARKGRDSILVLADSLIRQEGGGFKSAGGGFFFVDTETGTYLTKVQNEHFKVVPWENEDRGGDKYSVFTPAYNDERDLIAYRLNSPKHVGNLAVTSLDGDFFEVYGASPNRIDSDPKWGPEGQVLAERRPQASFEPEQYRVMAANIETGELRELVAPETIGGAVGLRAPDY